LRRFQSADAKVALTYQGLTGLAEIALTGGAPDAALIFADYSWKPHSRE
jgi:hypothetical protein